MRRILTFFILILLAILLYPKGYYVLDSKQDIIVSNSNYQNIICYIINLDRSSERYEYVKPNVSKLGFEVQRISGVEGNSLSAGEILEKVDVDSYQKYLNHLPKKGTIGCSLSHIKLWKRFLESNFEFAVVFEDDVTFDPATLSSVIKEVTETKELWDIIGFEISHNGTPLNIKSLRNNYKLSLYLTEITHTGAYIINRKAALKLLEKALPIKMPIDHYFTRSWEFDLKFTGIENPRLVHQRYGDSLINISENIDEKPKNFSLYKSIYKIQSYTIRFLYNFKLYVKSYF